MSISSNKKAFFDYFIEEKFECGIVLKGTEVKSIREAKVSIKESFVRIIKDEVFIMGMYIAKYEQGNIHNVEERRVRKLLMHKKEIKKLHEKVKEKGSTIVALNIFLKRGLVKVEIALAKGKKNYDKREVLSKKAQERDMARETKNYR